LDHQARSGGVAASRTAGVVYADTIKAHRVIADQIYVRELDRR
jgi:hypothetical protein